MSTQERIWIGSPARWSLGKYQLLLFLVLISDLVYQVAFNPEIGFLKPASKGEWIVAPRDPVQPLSGEFHTTLFRKVVRLPEKTSLSGPATATISAARCYRFSVNGRIVSGSREADVHRDWKVSRTYEISKTLHAGENLLEVLVGNTTRSPALLIAGSIPLVSGIPVRFDTDRSWQVSTQGQWVAPEPVVPERDFYPGHLAESPANSAYGRAFRIIAALMTWLLILAAVILFRRVRKDEGIHREVSGGSRRRVILVLFFVFAVLTVPMAWLRPSDTGWDAQGHIDYIRYVAAHWKLPLGEQGWEMYQPPAYYFLAAVIYKILLPLSAHAASQSQAPDFTALKAIQLLTPLWALFQILISLKIVTLFDKELRGPKIMVALFIGMIPMQIYVSSFISNEVFSSLVMTLSLFTLILMVRRNDYGILPSLLMGLTGALACLSKYTGLLVPATVIFVYGVFFLRKMVNRKVLVSSFLIIISVILFLSGPFYFRNYSHYGKFLPSNQELTKTIIFEYRGIGYYLDPTLIGIGAVDKFISRTVSFVDGNYSSMWLDNSHKSYHWTRVFEVLTYFLALFPTFLIVAGFCYSILSLNKDSELSKLCFPVLVFFTLAIFAYLSYLLRVVGYETARAFYLLSQIAPLAIFLDIGIRGDGSYCLRKQRLWTGLLLILYGAIFLYYILVPILIGKGY